MANVQDLFSRIEQSKKEQKGIKAMYADALNNHPEYQKTKDEIKALKDKKKGIEDSLKNDFSSEFAKLDSIKLDIENDKMLMSDAAVSQLMSGQRVEVVDENNNRYEPVFGVRFKKI